MTKTVSIGDEWARVATELSAESLKLQSYDNTLVSFLSNSGICGKEILDYGAGPAVLAYALQKLHANVKVYDISPEMKQKAGARIGLENVIESPEQIPANNFYVVVCNLVMCIVDETEAARIASDLYKSVKKPGVVYVGFCNPLIFDVHESQLDFRDRTVHTYDENHTYWKTKKEGEYRIQENHRPIEWYESVFRNVGFKAIIRHFTPEYEFNGRKIQDFVIFELKK